MIIKGYKQAVAKQNVAIDKVKKIETLNENPKTTKPNLTLTEP